MFLLCFNNIKTINIITTIYFTSFFFNFADRSSEYILTNIYIILTNFFLSVLDNLIFIYLVLILYIFLVINFTKNIYIIYF